MILGTSRTWSGPRGGSQTSRTDSAKPETNRDHHTIPRPKRDAGGIDEVGSIDELGTAVIDDTLGRRRVVDIDDGAIVCRTCDRDCDHAEHVETALRDHGLLEGE